MIEKDTLFLGLTRHAMKWGMPTYFFYISFMAVALSYLLTQNYILLLVLPGVLWLAGTWLGGNSSSMPLRIQKRLWLTRVIKNSFYWGVNTYR